MAKCGCSGTTCGCRIQGSDSVSVTGTGTAQDPYVLTLDDLSVATLIEVDDTSSINLTLGGSGTALDPYVISGVVDVGASVVTTAANGGTTVMDDGTRLQVFDHVSTIAGHTLTLPASSTALEKEIKVVAISAITALTVNAEVGATVSGAPTTLAAGGYFRMQLIGTVWRQVG